MRRAFFAVIQDRILNVTAVNHGQKIEARITPILNDILHPFADTRIYVGDLNGSTPPHDVENVQGSVTDGHQRRSLIELLEEAGTNIVLFDEERSVPHRTPNGR